MKDEKTMYPYFSEWMPIGDGCCTTAAYGTIEKGDYYG
jgi:hypothetical protein